MATFFGEILPVISRAVEDEEEDEFLEAEIMWESHADPENSQKISKVKGLIVGVGCIATGFLDAYCLQNGETVKYGTIHETLPDENSTLVSVLATFHANIAHGCCTVYCLCKSYLVPDKIWEFINVLTSAIQLDETSDVTVLDSASYASYLQCSAEAEVPFVKSLYTTAFDKKNSKFPALAHPNLVKGLAAAVMTHCELKHIPAILYVCYTDSISLDLASVNAFRPFLDGNNQKNDEQTDKATNHVKSLIASSGCKHSIYT
ncbi:proteasome assembly chaperone 1-like isoform X2 [Clavelina lepadiformis]|uniref:proteasome assembly chaperone 1-like isoform X2 n=1 Tax=Clavelina lepadiformis TaxID=159417 RepID=UPI00404283DD